MAQVENGNCFSLQMGLTTSDGQNAADTLIVESMLAFLSRQKIRKGLKDKSGCTKPLNPTNFLWRRTFQIERLTPPTHTTGIRISPKRYL